MKYCDGNCNECVILLSDNNRMLTRILNEAFERFGEEFYHIVQKNCPNLTCCHDCHIDDFCHTEGCEIVKDLRAEKRGRNKKQVIEDFMSKLKAGYQIAITTV